jgi:ribosome maturation factor RimP
VDVEVVGRGPATVVRIFLDKPGGITHGDCQNVSRQVGTILDVEDVMDSRYTLEVSSPGLDRRLTKQTDYERFAGQNLKVELKNPIEGCRRFQGRLLGTEAGQVKVETAPGGVVAIPQDEIERANLVPEIGKIGRLPGKKARG